MAFEPAAFFLSLGLLPRPLFGQFQPRPASEPVAASVAKGVEPAATPMRTVGSMPLGDQGDLILLDGVTASFALSRVERQPDDDEHYFDWSWSSHVTHHVEIDEHRDGTGVVFVRRWDSPTAIRRFTLRSVLKYGTDFISALEQAGPSRGSSSISRALLLLRQVRETMARSSRPEACVRVFHALLLGAAEAKGASEHDRRRWLDAKTLEEANSVFPSLPSAANELTNTKLYSVQAGFLSRDPASGRSLEPYLLLRHAAGLLYEEAHRELDRAETQTTFDFFTPAGRAPTHKANSVIHFTPPGLSRIMAELAWRYYHERHEASGEVPVRKVVVLDPACGSGSFLLESYLCSSDQPNKCELTLRGMDVSDRAIEMASLALEDVTRGDPAKPTISLLPVDSLSVQWERADIVLMNPPFMAWNDLTDRQKDTVKEICGAVSGRPDLATAFVLRAIDCLTDGGVLAAVLPSSLLSASSAEFIRSAIAQKTDVHLIGRFRGNDIFPNAQVEPSILLVQRKSKQLSSLSRPLTMMLLSSPGSSEAALRALRRGTLLPADTGRYELYQVPLPAIETTVDDSSEKTAPVSSWLPRPQLLRELIPRFEASELPRVEDLFSVKQGIRSGANEVFVLSSATVESMPEKGRKYFRPLAGNKTIEDGKIVREEFIFYPYNKSGLMLETEQDVARAVRSYYEDTLVPAKEKLRKRAGIGDAWWAPTRPRSWQYTQRPKLVSSYFGRVGKFAFDGTGDFVVGQGFGWILKDNVSSRVRGSRKPFVKTEDITREAGPAYVALFNSRRFSQILSYYTYRVMGGQFDLSARFMNRIPIPDLISPRSDFIAELRDIGARMGRGEWPDSLDRLDDVVALVYGTTPALWPVDLE